MWNSTIHCHRLTVFCFQGVEKGYIGNKWVNRKCKLIWSIWNNEKFGPFRKCFLDTFSGRIWQKLCVSVYQCLKCRSGFTKQDTLVNTDVVLFLSKISPILKLLFSFQNFWKKVFYVKILFDDLNASCTYWIGEYKCTPKVSVNLFVCDHIS